LKDPCLGQPELVAGFLADRGRAFRISEDLISTGTGLRANATQAHERAPRDVIASPESLLQALATLAQIPPIAPEP
jgi:hypothetical protein